MVDVDDNDSGNETDHEWEPGPDENESVNQQESSDDAPPQPAQQLATPEQQGPAQAPVPAPNEDTASREQNRPKKKQRDRAWRGGVRTLNMLASGPVVRCNLPIENLSMCKSTAFLESLCGRPMPTAEQWKRYHKRHHSRPYRFLAEVLRIEQGEAEELFPFVKRRYTLCKEVLEDLLRKYPRQDGEITFTEMYQRVRDNLERAKAGLSSGGGGRPQKTRRREAAAAVAVVAVAPTPPDAAAPAPTAVAAEAPALTTVAAAAPAAPAPDAAAAHTAGNESQVPQVTQWPSEREMESDMDVEFDVDIDLNLLGPEIDIGNIHPALPRAPAAAATLPPAPTAAATAAPALTTVAAAAPAAPVPAAPAAHTAGNESQVPQVTQRPLEREMDWMLQDPSLPPVPEPVTINSAALHAGASGSDNVDSSSSHSTAADAAPPLPPLLVFDQELFEDCIDDRAKRLATLLQSMDENGSSSSLRYAVIKDQLQRFVDVLMSRAAL